MIVPCEWLRGKKIVNWHEGSNEIVWWRSMKFPVSETGIQAVSK
jgi:hypothetical protein